MGLSPSSSFLVPASTPDTTNNQVIGALAAKQASQWRQQTISQALDEVLFPTIPPTFNQPTLTLSTTWPSFVERGTQTIGNMTPTWTQNQAGAALNYNQITNGAEAASIQGSPQVVPNVFTSPVTSTITFAIRVNYLAGSPIPNNKGVLVPNPIGAGSIVSNAVSVTGIYPYFYLKSPVPFTRQQFVNAIANDTANAIHASAVLTKVVSPANGTLTIPYNLNAQFFGVAHANGTGGYNNKLSFYTSESDQGPIAAAFTVGDQTTAVNFRWSGQSFRYYITPGAITNSNPNIQLRETTT
jgi:hypothetical protein